MRKTTTLPRSSARRQPKRCGELAELAFLHKASNQGLNLSKPYGDSDRYDFIADTGLRLLKVQVKSTSYEKAPQVYSACVGRHLGGKLVPYLPGQVDFIVVYLVPEDSWYILPMHVVDGKVMLWLHSRTHPKPGVYGKYLDAWPLLTGTLPEPEIAPEASDSRL